MAASIYQQNLDQQLLIRNPGVTDTLAAFKDQGVMKEKLKAFQDLLLNIRIPMNGYK